MATHSSVFAWKIPSTEESGGLESMRSQRVEHDRAYIHTHTHTHTHTHMKTGFFRETEESLRKEPPDTNIQREQSSKEMAKSQPSDFKVISNTEFPINFCSFSSLNMNNQSHMFIET